MGIPKNNAAPAEPSEGPETVILDRADLLQVLLLHERKQRISAEQRATEMEERAVLAELSAKYGINMRAYTVVVDEGVARRNPSSLPPSGS